MIYFSQLRAGLISTALLLTTALASPALAETLPEISPRQIAQDVEVRVNPQTGTQEILARSFDPFEEDPNLAGNVSLRSVSGQTSIDGQPLRGGALLDMTFYYNSGSDDPYDTRGFEEAVFLSGEYSAVTLRDNRILECNQNVQDVVYYHDDYYRPSLYANGFQPYRHYSGHFGYDRFWGSGYGLAYGTAIGFGSNRGFGTARSFNRNRNNTARRNVRNRRNEDRTRSREDRSRRNADRTRSREDRSRRNEDRTRNREDRSRRNEDRSRNNLAQREERAARRQLRDLTNSSRDSSREERRNARTNGDRDRSENRDARERRRMERRHERRGERRVEGRTERRTDQSRVRSATPRTRNATPRLSNATPRIGNANTRRAAPAAAASPESGDA